MANDVKKSLADLIALYPQFITDWGINHPFTVNIRTLVVRFGRDVGKRAMTEAVRAAREGSLIDPQVKAKNLGDVSEEDAGEGNETVTTPPALKRFMPGNYSKEPTKTEPKKQIFRKLGTEEESDKDESPAKAAQSEKPAEQPDKKKAATLKEKGNPQDTSGKSKPQTSDKRDAAEGDEKDSSDESTATATVDTGDGVKDSQPLSSDEITDFKTLKPAAALHKYGEVRILLTLKALNIDVDAAWKGAQVAAALKQKLPK